MQLRKMRLGLVIIFYSGYFFIKLRLEIRFITTRFDSKIGRFSLCALSFGQWSRGLMRQASDIIERLNWMELCKTANFWGKKRRAPSSFLLHFRTHHQFLERFLSFFGLSNVLVTRKKRSTDEDQSGFYFCNEFTYILGINAQNLVQSPD